ncbi:MAG: aminopeptidase P family protein [Proteobacteria bacterium]|nr:aminopeptidase P family protein [Pseudomonadota bacterium]
MKKGKLLFANDANAQYATGESFVDKYIYFEDKYGKSHACFSNLEIDRAKQNCKLDYFHSLEFVIGNLKDAEKTVTIGNVIKYLLDEFEMSEVLVPDDFPAKLYQDLTNKGIKLEIENVFFPKRMIKKPEEIAKIKQAQKMNEDSFKRAFEILKESKIADDKALIWQGEILTSEILRNEMNVIVAKFGGIAFEGGPVVACGVQGSMPHETGYGPLYANELIVIDSFPRHANFYYSDITRTVIKGKANKIQEQVFQSVLDAQLAAFDLLKASAIGNDVHKRVQEVFEADGFVTGKDKNGVNEGFFHSTGHNLGLECHDVGAALGAVTNELKAGQVVTVEPGLYYPNIGGVRIEDTVVITENGFENLTSLEKVLVIV